jgi:Ca2+-binding RTX toxin-like protein
MATILWSTLLDGSTIAFDPATDVLRFDSTSISAADRNMLTWTGNDVIFSVGGKADPSLNHTVHFTMTGGGRALTDANVLYDNGSKLFVGDNSHSIGNGTSTFDDAANILTGTAGGDRFVGLGGNDTLNGLGGNDTFVLNNGPLPFGADSVDGGAGLGDAIGVGTHASILHSAVVDFSTHMVTSADGSAVFSNIENAFGTNFDDSFFAFDPSRVLTGLGAPTSIFDFARFLEGFAGSDTFVGDSRPGYFEEVTYAGAPSGVTVNLATGVATDGYDSDTVAGGVQPYTDTLVDIDGVQGSAFGDLLIGGGTGTTFSGLHFEQFEGMAGNDTLDANGAPNVRADYLNSPAGVSVNLAAGTASDGWGGTDTLLGIAGVRGSNFNDTLIGDAGNNFLEGRGGNDVINGGAGADILFYSSATSAVNIDLALGMSSLTGGLGTDHWAGIEGVRGGDFNDTLRGTAGNNVLDGGAGADLLDGRGGTDLVRYDRSPNAVDVNLTSGTALDGYDSDSIAGGIQPYTDTLLSIERVRGSTFADSIVGDGANNGIEGWAGDDFIDGRLGVDTAEYANSPGAVVVDLATGLASDGWGGSDTLAGMENVLGSAFNDTIAGDANANALTGGAGDDSLAGGDGGDVLAGNQGDDRLDGGEGGDLLTGGQGNDFISGGGGDDQATGNIGDDVIDGGAGNDYLHGGPGSDFVDGGDGNDVLFSDDGADTLLGGNGDDTLFGAADSAARFLDGGAGNDQLYGGNGNDSVAGGDGADKLQGQQGDDVLDGGAGSDTLFGNLGNDSLVGGDGSDVLIGNIGDDTLEGGAGDDHMIGGPGSDLYRYGAASLDGGDVTAGGHDSIGADAGDVIGMLGLTDELQIGGVALNALTADALLPGALTANTSVAFSGGVLMVDLDGDGSFNPADDFQISLGGVTAATYNVTDDLFHLA